MSQPIFKGQVTRSTGIWYLVKHNNGNVYNCRLKGQLKIKGYRATNPVVVGDFVDFSLEPKSDTGLILKIHERKNYIIRRSAKLSKESHIIAANIDRAFLIATLTSPRTSTGFIDRFLVTAAAYNIPATIVINKLDIYDNSHLEILKKMEYFYKKAGYSFLCVSALYGNNLDMLKNEMKNNICLFAGHSGSGKSAIINAIQPHLNLKTGEISQYHLKGKHTTTFSEMFPLNFGGYIIDSPGIKEFALIDIKKDELFHFFPEMFNLLHKCKFHNCTHTNEPNCAVKKAVADGEIAEWRYKNYISILSGDYMDIKDWK